MPSKARISPTLLVVPIVIVGLAGWFAYIGHEHSWRWALLSALGAGSFVVGSLLGFVLTTYSDEVNTIGKLRDSLVGALAGITLVNIAGIRPVLQLFTLSTAPREYALVLAVALVFATLGFYFMFFGRELIFNIPLARKRAQRFVIETTREAGTVTVQLNASLPASVLIGYGDAESLLKNDPAKAAALEQALCSKDVETFLDQCTKAIANGRALEWDLLYKAANLQYYRAYLKDSPERPDQKEVALEWITRALVINPDHVDLTVKRADTLALLERFRDTAGVLDGLYQRVDCPFYVEQWLGFYLLYIPGREDDAIRCCSSYLAKFPDSNESLRNLACAHAQKACLAAKHSGGPLNTDSPEYVEALSQLREVIRTNPDYLETIRDRWCAEDGSFNCFGNDPQFQKIVGAPTGAKSSGATT